MAETLAVLLAAAAFAAAASGEDAKPAGDAAARQPAPAQAQPQVQQPDDQQPPPIQPRRTRAELEAIGGEIQEFQKAVEQIQAQSEELRREIQLQIERKFEDRKRTVRRTYEKAIKDLEVKQRKQRKTAIARFEAFLKKYPADPKYTPDALFRLSELYYERVNDEFMIASDEYEKKAKEYRDGKIKTEPQKPYRNLEEIIVLYRRLVNEYPQYHSIDIVYYLLGFALWDQGDEKRSRLSETVLDLGELEKLAEPPEFKESKDMFTVLVTRWPGSRYASEAWLRIGEFYFNSDDSNKLETKEQYLNAALDAYRRSVTDQKSPLYDKVVYKIAWTYYRKGDMDTAVKYFADLVDFYEQQKKVDKKAKADLQSDAYRFLAIMFSDDLWKGSGVENAKAFFAARGNPSYMKDFFKELGDTLYYDMVGAIIGNRSNFQEADDAYRHIIQMDPYNPQAPELQGKIIESYMRSDNLDPEAAAKERSIFIKTYAKHADCKAPGAADTWWCRNSDDPNAQLAVEGMTEKLLYYAAASHHERAQKLRQAEKLQEALQQYTAAAKAYGEYLQMFPHSKNAYDLRFYYADCLYYSFFFADAAVQYEAVRDSTAGNKFYADALKSAWLAWSKEIEHQIKEKKLAELKLVGGKDRKEGEKIAPKPIAAIWKKLVADYDFQLNKAVTSEDSAKIALHAMQIFYAHDDLEEVRKRGQWILEKFPKDPVVKSASELIVETYLAVKDWDKVAEWSDRIQQQGLGDQTFKMEMGKLEAGALFKRAEKMYNDGKYEEAASEYVRLVNKKPENEFADRALIMAAKSYEKLRKFDSAAKVYDRIYTEYPKSEYASPSLFLVAQNLEKGFQFEGAVGKYLMLVDKYADSKDRASALYNAASILDNIQDYQRSIDNFQRFIKTFPDNKYVPDVAYRIIIIHEKMKDWNNAIRSCEQYQKKYGGDPAQANRVVETYVKIAEAYEKLGNQKLVTRAYENVMSEFERRKLGPNTRAAYYAAKAKFLEAETKFQRYDAIRLGSNPRRLKNELENKARMNIEVERAYEAVYPYKQAEWTLAAMYRIGFAKQRFAATLYEAPIPKELKTDEEKEVYRAGLEEVAGPIEDQAVLLYESARKAAVAFKVVNEWTKKTLESLNKLRPSQYPLQKEPKGLFQDSPLRPGDLDVMDKVKFDMPWIVPPPAPMPQSTAAQPQAQPPQPAGQVAPAVQQQGQTPPVKQDSGQKTAPQEQGKQKDEEDGK